MPDDAPVTSAVVLSFGVGRVMPEAYWSWNGLTIASKGTVSSPKDEVHVNGLAFTCMFANALFAWGSHGRGGGRY
jgi:hypothetical protein